MSTRVGIDLGTTNSCIAYIDDIGQPVVCPNAEGKSTTPSVVAIKSDGQVLVGDDAVEMAIHCLEPSVANFKRDMGDPTFLWEAHGRTYSPVELSAFILKKLVDDAEMALGVRPRQAVVTVPAYFRDPERVATRRAIDLAGLEEIQIVNEPTAAAIAYGAENHDKQARILVYDLGGGTFDVTVLDLDRDWRVLGSNGDHHLGGADWDERLAQYFAELFEEEHDQDPFADPEARADMMPAIEGAKRRLSSISTVRLSIGAHGQRSSYSIDRSTFEQITADLVARTMALTDDILDELDLKSAQIDEVVLVGGSTRMPMVVETLTKKFGQTPRRSINPDEAVALGAAILAETKQQDLTEAGKKTFFGLSHRPAVPSGNASTGLRYRPIQDITNHSLGMIAVNEKKDAYINVPILPRNQPIPCKAHRPFHFIFHKPSDQLEVFVTQGELSDPSSVAFVGRYIVSNLPGTEFRKPSTIEIAYHYDGSGVVSVKARQKGQRDWTPVSPQPLPNDVPERFTIPPEPEVIREHLSIVIFIDVSGSMSGKPLAESKTAAKRFLEDSDLTSTSIGIGVVSNSSRVLLKPSQNAKEIELAINNIECGSEGYGNEAHPFDDIYELMSGVDGLCAGIVLADGVWYEQEKEKEKAIQEAERCHNAQIEIVGIGFGSADESFIKAISSLSDLGGLTSQDRLSETFSSVAQVLGEKAGMRII